MKIYDIFLIYRSNIDFQRGGSNKHPKSMFPPVSKRIVPHRDHLWDSSEAVIKTKFRFSKSGLEVGSSKGGHEAAILPYIAQHIRLTSTCKNTLGNPTEYRQKWSLPGLLFFLFWLNP